MNPTDKQYRYPGTRPFTEDDRLLFFGRNDDIERLHRQVIVEKLIVLFGKSGLGKSSLLNAGVIPLLKEQDNFMAIPMILGFARAENLSPSVFFLNKLSRLIDYENILWEKIAGNYKDNWMNATCDESFWLACKSLQIQNPGKPLVFVLDQFEELFSAGMDDINLFGYLLSTLLHGQTPQNIKEIVIERLKKDKAAFTRQEINLLFEPLEIKVVISTRSDKLSLLNRLKNHIPQILQKTYELQSLTTEQAQEAMLKPASAEGNFISPAFNYDEKAEAKIINYLSAEKEKPIETFQLQLICQFCENLVIKGISNPGGIIKETDLGDLSTIFTRHYDTLIHEISDTSQQLAARQLIEENLIIEGNRVPLPDKVIIAKHHISTGLLQKLVNSRLLRSEPNNVGGFSYEISHDTLVEPITTSYKIRFEKEEKERKAKEEQERHQKLMAERKRQRTIITIVSVAAVISVAFGIFGFVNMRIANNSIRSLLIKDAYSFFKEERFMAAKGKYEELLRYSDTTKAIKERIDECIYLDSLSKIFYKETNEIDSLMKKADLESLKKINIQLDQIDSLQYKPGKEKLKQYRETYKNKISSIISENIRLAEMQLNAGVPEHAANTIHTIEPLDPFNQQIIEFKKQNNIK